MVKSTGQMQEWAGNFGKEYTDRNTCTSDQIDRIYKENYGISRLEMTTMFLGKLNKDIRILEVGSNDGNKLVCLQDMGFKNLYGIELQSYAIELSKGKTRNINLIQGSAFDIPFKDGYFDLVFTSGVLIHIAPEDITVVLDEIYRCTDKYIWGFEYYADNYTAVPYHGHVNLLWKTDFSRLFLERFGNLEKVREEHFKYLENDNIDAMYLLKKK
jgi:pseudaminic acid biosynthesis-associated methylase